MRAPLKWHFSGTAEPSLDRLHQFGDDHSCPLKTLWSKEWGEDSNNVCPIDNLCYCSLTCAAIQQTIFTYILLKLYSYLLKMYQYLFG